MRLSKDRKPTMDVKRKKIMYRPRTLFYRLLSYLILIMKKLNKF